jgi:membrane-bound metal-dependent hydrolase YbcI (DUF457 family)
MPFGFTHMFLAYVTGKVIVSVKKIKVDYLFWFFLILGGILPDGDFVLDWIFGLGLHRTYSHSLPFMILVGLGVYYVFKRFGFKNSKMLGFGVSLGILVHIVADILTTSSCGGPAVFWPIGLYFARNMVCDTVVRGFHEGSLNVAIFDMGIGAFWFLYVIVRHKIKL